MSQPRRSVLRKPRVWIGVMTVLSSMVGMVRAADDEAAAIEVISAAFKRLDVDGNQLLSAVEYRSRGGSRAVLDRDFKLFDFDADGVLNRDEFSAVPGLVQVAYRGPIPEPFIALLERGEAAMDETYGQWDRNPDRTIPEYGFVESFLASVAPEEASKLTAGLLEDVDRDNDGQVRRDDVRHFLSVQLGVRRREGDLLRTANGRVVNYALYLGIDVNRDDKLSRDEFLMNWHDKAKAAEVFAQANRDGNDFISFAEFCENTPSGYHDVLEMFRRMDRNLDATIDPQELAEGTSAWQKPLIGTVFPGFDLDRDGRLTLDEFLMTMQVNMLLPWQRPLIDSSRDDRISFGEFTWDKGQFVLLRRLYFTRLDRDANGFLSADEFAFVPKPPDALYVLNADGTNWKKLYDSKEFPSCGSPAVSSDGKFIAFDGYRATEGLSKSRLFVATIDGRECRDLCHGLMPSWSPDGTQLACSRYENGNVVAIVNADGTDHKKIGEGWGAQWSPDGKRIAFTRGKALMAYDLETDTEAVLLADDKNPYSFIYYNAAWSADGERLCFKGMRTNSQGELASIRTTGDDPDLQVHLEGEQSFDNDMGWSPDGRQLVFGMQSPERKRTLLHVLDLDPGAKPRLLPGQETGLAICSGACWTPDGKQIIVRVRPE